MFKHSIWIWIFSCVNGVVMLLLALYWLSLPRTFEDEAFFIKWTGLIKKSLIGLDEKPAPEDLLYVDVSNSKALLPVLDSRYQEFTGYQNEVITDREQLAVFLNFVADYGEDIPLVLIDIFFELDSPYDSLLQAAIDKIPFALVGARNYSVEESSAIDLPRGAANYLTTDGSFMKYPLFFEDSVPTLPLVALYKTDSLDFKKGVLWSWIGGKPYLTNPIVDFKIRPVDLNYGQFNSQRPYTIHQLGSLLFEWEFWDEADIRKMLKGKMIIIGDFKHDEHNTVFGTIPGPIVVHNAYLTLAADENRISWTWLLLLFALFFWMSFRVYKEEKTDERSWLFKQSKTALGKIVADSIDDTFFLAVGTIVSYFLFNIHVNILILLIYIKLVAFILRFFFSGRALRYSKSLKAVFGK